MKCTVCGREMLTEGGCTPSTVCINGHRHKRIPVSQFVHGFDVGPSGRCEDCGAPVGSIHHWGCDVEKCPVCGRQLISCTCKDVHIKK